jgi:spore maturation protein A
VAVLFFLMVVASLLWLTVTAPSSILATALAAGASGVQLAITLAGIYIVWMGIIQVAIDAGLIDALARACRPVIRFLFGEQSDEVNALLATNISANMIGAGNAATPAAIEAIEKMSTPDMTRATTPMIMLFILSATSMQILPTTVIGILEASGAQNASSIILPTFAVSTITTIMGIIMVKVFGSWKKRAVLNETK